MLRSRVVTGSIAGCVFGQLRYLYIVGRERPSSRATEDTVFSE
jgi:hypothetical protein